MSKHKVTAEQLTASAWEAALKPQMITDTVPPGWFTAAQLCEKLGKPRGSMGRMLVNAVEQGRCERKMFRVNVGAFARSTPHYRLK